MRILAADFVTDVADALYVGSTVRGIRYIRYHIRCQQRYLKVFSQAVKDSRNCPAIWLKDWARMPSS